ncbi:hypothetical protein CKM354_000494200 [Cercospora kikuchii]|uniref:Uncharacterized protein n=1 Tax=Cercospora kikuchii TaxID=84275 RepID=A0A9P3FBZ3_9PEZI|nr:uncharacterized protein CKM354_000494200 [Cercospora kikuchii]GIZ41643.1 hypothetical protein CKM354_000494200 [Cercospora kikuchii]
MARRNEQREEASQSPSNASEAEPSTGEEVKAHMDEEIWTEEDDWYQEEEPSSSSSPSSSSEEEDHDPPHPRAKQTARRGDHLGFLARMARRSSDTNEHSSTTEAEIESRPDPRTHQTARRGDHAGFLARMALRNGQITKLSGPSNEAPGHPNRLGKQTARRGGLTASNFKRSVQDRVSDLMEETEWDITGDWEIECDTLANWSGYGPQKLSLAIYHDKARPGGHMAFFDLHISTGIMRITCPTPRTTDKKLRGTYVYRGRETGEGEILLGSDSRIYKIVFKNRGTRLKGKYAGAGSERVTFTGSKVKRGLQRRASSTDGWESFSEEEWARASVGRWGGWVG